ncbi:hypothetical protein CR205_14215 [Alteribacter lacisalsi]|uniref:Thioredoxin n=1 Tax=Alteribacter lacisalsi TaxID=2045244 RepID=A0A2W0H9U5_9BACI|nr:thioredoxin family protein [Alteribacter lacisalsi]PYZ96830.1 hypothetical protein CR205_14215 [Alteribacter lacisalsi]
MTLRKIESFEEVKDFVSSSDRAIVLLKSKNCTVCEAVERQLEEQFHNEIVYAKGQIEDVPEARGQWTVFSAPTVLFFFEGREVWRGSRFIDWDDLNRMIIRTLPEN